MTGETAMRATVLHMLPDLSVGGGQVLLLRNLDHLVDGPWMHQVCALAGGPMEADYKAAGVEVLVMDHKEWRSTPWVLAKVVRLARRANVRLIHTNNTPLDRIVGQLAGLLLGIPVVNTFHALAPVGFPAPVRLGDVLPFVRQRVTRFVNRHLIGLNLRQLIAVSEAVRQTQSAWLSLPPERFTVIHNGLPPGAAGAEIPAVTVDAVRRELGLGGRHPVILSVGRLVEGKGQRLLPAMMVDVVRRWPEALLLLAGEGEDRPVIEAMIAADGLSGNVRLLGNRSDVPMLLTAADLFISTSFFEGFGLAVLEAMAAGKPVVALRTPALSEFLEDGASGFIVDGRDPHGLAEAVGRLAADRVLAHRFGARGRERARAFTADRTAAKLAVIYASLLRPAGTAHDTAPTEDRQIESQSGLTARPREPDRPF